MKCSLGISNFLEEVSSLSHFVVENFACNMQTQVQLPDRKTHWRRAWQPTPVFWPGEFHGLREAEDIKKRWQEYTEELYKKDFHDPDNHDGVITDLEPDILECEVQWAFETSLRTKLVEVMEFQLSYFKS